MDAPEKLVAHRLTQKIAPSTGWPTETWVIRQEDMTPIAQLELYFYQEKDPELVGRAGHAQWFLWTGSITRAEIRRLGMRLQDARNAVKDAETLSL
jgi:hypothetical protein